MNPKWKNRDPIYNQFEKLMPEVSKAHKAPFKNPKIKANLISEWEQHTGQVWPKYEALNPKTGEMSVKNVQAHHVIPQQRGGPHEWWNMHPVFQPQHQGGIHGARSPLTQIVKEVKNVHK